MFSPERHPLEIRAKPSAQSFLAVAYALQNGIVEACNDMEHPRGLYGMIQWLTGLAVLVASWFAVA